MRYDEFAFVNQQLAGMLRSGIPLEGGLRQLCASMRRGRLRQELRALEKDLAEGKPLAEALPKRRLPEFYRHMLQVGVQSGDLPGMLILMADYYQRLSFIWTRLKGLLIYPAIVLVMSLGLSVFLTYFLRTLTVADLGEGIGVMSRFPLVVWAPLFLLAVLAIGFFTFVLVPPVRRKVRWQLPGFREAGLSQVASAIGLMLRGGTDLDSALGMVRLLEKKSPAGREIERWRGRLAEGRGRFGQLAQGSRVFPPLFFWLAETGGEDLAAGFERASEIYFARAMHRTELMLYAALPVSVLFLGAIIVTQAYPVVQAFWQAAIVLDQLGM